MHVFGARSAAAVQVCMAAFAVLVLSAWCADAHASDEEAHARGRELFSQCERCHELDPGRGNRIGPNLFNVIGRPAASVEEFRYSKGMREVAGSGLAWTPENLDRFLADPRSIVRRTSMSFRGLDDADERADIIAFLSTVRPDDFEARPETGDSGGAEIGAAAMAMQGDVAYGEYLSTECVTCHQASGTDEGIPAIVGWPQEDFIRALFEYKSNVRDHPVMKLVTSNLGDEEIASLAAYFNQLGQ